MSAPQTEMAIHPLAFFGAELPWFVDLESLNFFAIDPVGDPETDRATGDRIAQEALTYARSHNSDALLAFALNSILERGRVGHLEAGFIIRITRSAMAGSMN